MTRVQKLDDLLVDTCHFLFIFVFSKLKVHWINYNHYFFMPLG
jgi:hypothetical protein